MNISKKQLPKSKVELRVEIPPAELEQYRPRALENLAKEIEMEGFRPGHVPLHIASKVLGENKIFAQVAHMAVQEAYLRALEEKNIDAIGEPEVEVLKLAPGNPLEFRIVVAVMPDVQLPDYKKIASAVARKAILVEEQEVQEALDWLEKSRKVEPGKTLAELDDFAKTVGNFESMIALKESLREGLQHEKEIQETNRLRQEIVERICAKAEMEIPELLVEREKRALLQNVKGKSEEDLLGEFQQEAEKRVKRFLVVREVAKQEGIQPARQEVQEEANAILAHYKSASKAEKEIDPARLQEYTEGVIRHEKTLQFLEQFATKP